MSAPAFGSRSSTPTTPPSFLLTLIVSKKSGVIPFPRTGLLGRQYFLFARHPPKDDYEAAEDSNVVRANGQIKKLLRRVRYHF
jgi:hypothetical protein